MLFLCLQQAESEEVGRLKAAIKRLQDKLAGGSGSNGGSGSGAGGGEGVKMLEEGEEEGEEDS